MSGCIKVLMLGADSVGGGRLGITREYAEIRRELAATPRVELELETWVEAARIQELLMREQPMVLHFTGHGNVEGELVFPLADGTPCPADPDQLARVFQLVGASLRCVVLNACHSELQARLIAQHVDAVVGMPRAIDDQTAIAFSAGFYQALALGEDILTAFELGKTRAALADLEGADSPVLFLREAGTKLYLAPALPAVDRTKVESALAELFLEIFSPGELRRAISELDNGHVLRNSLPGRNAPPVEIAERAAELLVGRRALKSQWFVALADQIPGRRRLIAQVASTWERWASD